MTIKNRFPDVAPVLNLDFANSKRLDPRITFTRASTGTYVDELGIIRTAAANQARFDHDSAGNSLGLLIEEARTNLVQYSENFSQTSQWSATNSTLTAASSITAPDGSTNAYKLVEDAVTGSHYVRCLPNNQCIAGTTYTYSMFVKAAERTQIMLHFDAEANSNVYFDLSSGEIVSGTIGTIKAVGNGWYHCSVTLQPASNTEPKFYTAVNGSISTTGDGVSGVYIWGAQLEQASFPTSYIPTSGSTATRSADVASMTGTNFSSWYNQSGGTLATNSRVYPLPLNYTQRPYCAVIMNSNGSQYWGQTWENCGEGAVRVDTTAGAIASNTGLNLQTNQIYNVTYKSALGIEFSGDVNVNGIGRHSHQGLTATNVSVPKNTAFVDRLTFGTQINGNGQTGIWQGHISRLTYYDRRLTDAQLQALTL